VVEPLLEDVEIGLLGKRKDGEYATI